MTLTPGRAKLVLMARPLRLEFPGALYHVTARGNARAEIFLDDDDRRRFLDLLGREVEQQRWHCTAYCLMTNHYHLLLETPEANLSRGMRRLNGSYTQAFNRRHGRVGHVLQGRYKSILVERDAYLRELCRYVVLNPVRAGMVEQAADYPWSSYRASAGLEAAPAWLDVPGVQALFGDDPTVAAERYARFVAEGVGRPSPWQDLRGQVFLGGERFLAEAQKRLEAGVTDLESVPKSQRWATRPTAEEVLARVAARYGLARNAVLDRTSGPAFKAAMYLLRRVANLPLNEAAVLGGIHPSRVSRIQVEVEREGRVDEGLRSLLAAYRLNHPSPPD